MDRAAGPRELHPSRDRSISRRDIRGVTIGIPARDEEATVGDVVRRAHAALRYLSLAGEVLVAASGCTDGTARVASDAGARVLSCQLGKGNAVAALVAANHHDVLCLVDGDLIDMGPIPLAVHLLAPIVDGRCDATVSDLWWRNVWPDVVHYGFHAPLLGRLFPEVLARVGKCSWTGQRAAVADAWPAQLPTDYQVEMALNLHWGLGPWKSCPVPCDDWTQTVRVHADHSDQLWADIQMVLEAAKLRQRLIPAGDYRRWFEQTFAFAQSFGGDDAAAFERELLDYSLRLMP